MALKSTTKKTPKPAATARSVSASKSPAAVKPAARVAKPVAKAEKTPVKAAAVAKPAPVAVKAADPKPAPLAAKPQAPKPVTVATKPAAHAVTLSYFAPEAGSVLVAGDFTKWEASPISLVKEGTGVWKATLSLKPGKYQYRLLVDGHWQNDPQCAETQPNAFGSANCVLSVAA